MVTEREEKFAPCSWNQLENAFLSFALVAAQTDRQSGSGCSAFRIAALPDKRILQF